jgi:Porin subfamily
MSLIKGSLLSTAAVLVSLGTAHAADLPVKAAPAQYMKVCNLYGDGFYYIPGTDTCLKLGGYLRIQNEYNMGAGGGAIGNGSTEAAQARFARDVTNDMNYRVRAAMTWDVRQQTDYGTLRTYIRWGAENTTPLQTGGGTTFSPFWDRVFLQFAGFTVGKAVSFFDLFTYAPSTPTTTLVSPATPPPPTGCRYGPTPRNSAPASAPRCRSRIRRPRLPRWWTRRYRAFLRSTAA